MSPFCILLVLIVMEVTIGQLELWDVQSSSQIIITNKPTSSFLQARCPSCRPTNSVKALKGVLRLRTNCLTELGWSAVMYWQLMIVCWCMCSDAEEDHKVRHLTPVVVSFTLPADYPSVQPPYYSVSCHWLSHDQVSLVRQRSLTRCRHFTFWRA